MQQIKLIKAPFSTDWIAQIEGVTAAREKTRQEAHLVAQRIAVSRFELKPGEERLVVDIMQETEACRMIVEELGSREGYTLLKGYIENGREVYVAADRRTIYREE